MKLRKLLNTILFLPLLPIIGIPDGAGDANGGSAAGGAQSGTGDAGASGNTNSGQGDQNGSGDNSGSAQGDTGTDGKADRTFTQAEVTAMMTKEKNQGRTAALAELGITDPAQAKTLLELAAKLVDAGKTDADKLTDEGKKAQAAELRAQAAENKLSLMVSGVKPEFIDDVFALASARVTDTTDFKAAVEAVKKAHSAFFNEAEGGDANKNKNGTGKPPAGGKGGDSTGGSYGKRAAAVRAQSTGQKSSFFKNT